MKPVNLRSMFATSAELCEKAINNEVVELGNAIEARKNLEFMLKCMELAHKHSVSAANIKNYKEQFIAFNPQLKDFDELPE